MTNKQYILKSLFGLGITEDDVDIILIKSNISPDTAVSVRDCDMAIYSRMSVVLKAVMQNVSEGGYSISWNIDAVKMYYNALCKELGQENVLFTRPKVRNKSNVW